MTYRLRALHRWVWLLVAAATLWILALAIQHRPTYPNEGRDTTVEQP